MAPNVDWPAQLVKVKNSEHKKVLVQNMVGTDSVLGYIIFYVPDWRATPHPSECLVFLGHSLADLTADDLAGKTRRVEYMEDEDEAWAFLEGLLLSRIYVI